MSDLSQSENTFIGRKKTSAMLSASAVMSLPALKAAAFL